MLEAESADADGVMTGGAGEVTGAPVKPRTFADTTAESATALGVSAVGTTTRGASEVTETTGDATGAGGCTSGPASAGVGSDWSEESARARLTEPAPPDGSRRDKSSSAALAAPAPLPTPSEPPAAEPPDAAVSGVVTPERAGRAPDRGAPLEPDEPDELAPDAPEVPDVSAKAIPGSTRIAAPTPSDTASAPTRPTYADELARPGRSDTFPPDPISRGRTSLPRLRLSASADWVLVAISRPRLDFISSPPGKFAHPQQCATVRKVSSRQAQS